MKSKVIITAWPVDEELTSMYNSPVGVRVLPHGYQAFPEAFAIGATPEAVAEKVQRVAVALLAFCTAAEEPLLFVRGAPKTGKNFCFTLVCAGAFTDSVNYRPMRCHKFVGPTNHGSVQSRLDQSGPEEADGGPEVPLLP